eukprot:scaffold47896_cov65-Phaeocystis_antarctica.AAC.2
MLPKICRTLFWANSSVGKKKGGDTTTRTEIETAGSGKDLGFGFGPSEPAAAKQHLTLSQGRTRHPQPLQPPSKSRAPEQKVDTRAKSEERQ